MSTAEQRQEWRELAGRLSYFGVESGACDAITALLADVDRLTGDNAALSEALDTALLHLTESEAERDALAAELAQVRAQAERLEAGLIEHLQQQLAKVQP
jgi:hypothetical protein